MPRAAASDPLHSFRFHARAVNAPTINGAGADILQPDGTEPGYVIGDGTEAGFNSITIPEITVEHAEYREGIRTYTMKFPGVPSIPEATLSRGVARYDTAFFNWVLAAIEGNEYRTDVTIYHVQRPSLEQVQDTSKGPNIDVTDEGVISKLYKLYECSPARVKIAADMDASTSDISLAEIDVSVERMDIVRPG